MTIEEAWLFWMKKNRSTNEPPTVTDFDVIRKSSHWAAFEAGWDAAAVNVNGFDQAYMMGVQAGKEIQKANWVGLTDAEIKEIVGPWGETPIKGYTRKLFDAIETKLKEKNT
jgi:hypothetical protein